MLTDFFQGLVRLVLYGQASFCLAAFAFVSWVAFTTRTGDWRDTAWEFGFPLVITGFLGSLLWYGATQIG